MRRILLAAVAAAALVGSAPAVASESPTATVACTNAKIAGQSKCIARGQYCSRSSQAMRDYQRYGLRCSKRDVNGRYHLQ